MSDGQTPDNALEQEGNAGIVMGVLVVLSGLLMALMPVFAFVSLTILIAVLLFVMGLCTLVAAFRRRAMERNLLDSLLGVLAIILAGVIAFNPVGSSIGLTVWIAAWFLVRGVMELAGMGASPYGRSLMALDALVNIVMGVTLLAINPLIAQALLGFYIAISLFFWGFSLIYRSALLKKQA